MAAVSLMLTCRWNWCSKTFSDSSSLREHVEQDHIAKALPVKRKDVPLLLRAEDGASLPESSLHVWTSDSGSRASAVPHRVDRAIMTDPAAGTTIATAHVAIASPVPQHLPSLSSASTQQHQENVRPFTFSELRGTPSPPPPPMPPSPTTTEIIKMIKPKPPSTYSLVTPDMSLMKPSLTHSPSRGTTNGRSVPLSVLNTPPIGNDDSDMGAAKVVGLEDPNVSMEVVESQLHSLNDMDDDADKNSAVNVLGSQWQPQSQLPLPESLENNASSPISTIDPTQLHPPLVLVPDSQPVVEHRGSDDRHSSPEKNVSDISSKPEFSPIPQSTTMHASKTKSERASLTGAASPQPQSFSLGPGYRDENRISQQLQTQAPLPESSLDSSWSQG